MPDEQNKNGNANPFGWKDLPPFFLALATLIYATGFLIIFTFHDSYGLQGVDAAFFKIRYAHVGILFLMLPLIATTAVYGWVNTKWTREPRVQPTDATVEHARPRRRSLVVIATWLGLHWRRVVVIAVLPSGLTYIPLFVFHEHHLCLFILMSLLIPACALYVWTCSNWARAEDKRGSHAKKEKKPHVKGGDEPANQQRSFRKPVVIIAVLMALTYYLSLVFAPPGAFFKQLLCIPLFLTLAFSITGGIVAHRMEDDAHKLKCNEKLKQADCVAILVILLLLACFSWVVSSFCGAFRDAPSLLAGVFFLCFVAGMSWMIHRLVSGVKEVEPSQGQRARAVLVPSILGVLYFITIQIFALGVYHYIPRSKGGGDYTEAGLVVLYFKENGESQVPSRIVAKGCSGRKCSILLLFEKGCAGGKHSIPLVMIEGTASSVFVADPKDGGQTAWRRRREERPNVIEIGRDMIASVEHQRTKTD